MLLAPAAADGAGRHAANQAVAVAWQRAYAAQPLPPLPAAHAQIAPHGDGGRGVADALAAWHRWHSPALQAQTASLFTPAQWPWYAVLERARVETQASLDLPGMALNLAQLQHLQTPHEPWNAIYLIARYAFNTGDTDQIGQRILDEPSQKPRSWWQRFRHTPLAKPRPTEAQITHTLCQAPPLLTDGLQFAHAVLPLVQALAAHHAGPPAGKARAPGTPHHRPNAKPQHDHHRAATQPAPATDGAASASLKQTAAEAAYPGYKVFSSQWDEEGPASCWFQPQDAQALHQLDTLDQGKTRQLALRLQRRLLAAQQRHWSFDQEEGRLDNRRLARLLARGDRPRVFRAEDPAMVPEACVTFLVDQSGSMRGASQRMTALAIDLAVQTLQICHIRCEVLGYTTRFGADNPAALQWRQTQEPHQPGRLNAVRHIVYKTPAQPWRRTRAHLGLLLRDGFGQENIDGEALHWAATRLSRQAQPRKILVVLSDGTPYDPATTQANGRSYLENYLREVIAQVECSPIHLVALGTGQGVGRYYRHSITLAQPGAVADTLFNHLAELLTSPA
jgi:cobaltochelatase CobT